jgi:hypothetical protein
MRYLNAYMGSLLLCCAIMVDNRNTQALLYSASAANFCVAIMPKDGKLDKTTIKDLLP